LRDQKKHVEKRTREGAKSCLLLIDKARAKDKKSGIGRLERFFFLRGARAKGSLERLSMRGPLMEKVCEKEI
jgi:hypothetical protein